MSTSLRHWSAISQTRRHPDSLCGWSQGFSRSDRGGLSKDSRAAVHRPYDQQQPQDSFVERLQAAHPRLKTICQAVNERDAMSNPERFRQDWPQYPRIADMWEKNRARIAAMFSHEGEIRRVICTTNAIESLNSVIRKATTRHRMFPDDEAAMKVAWLAVMGASRKWTMPILHWKSALNRFCIEFGDRVSSCL